MLDDLSLRATPFHSYILTLRGGPLVLSLYIWGVFFFLVPVTRSGDTCGLTHPRE